MFVGDDNDMVKHSIGEVRKILTIFKKEDINYSKEDRCNNTL